MGRALLRFAAGIALWQLLHKLAAAVATSLLLEASRCILCLYGRHALAEQLPLVLPPLDVLLGWRLRSGFVQVLVPFCWQAGRVGIASVLDKPALHILPLDVPL
jgi:hypothetical protein